MKLELIDGKVTWIKADGTPSKKAVSMKKVVAFRGFPELSGPGGGECKSLKVPAGEPSKNEIILVTASGNSWYGTFLLSKRTKESVQLWKEDMDYAEELVNEPPQGLYSLEEIIEQKRQIRRDAVDLEALAQQRGLAVWLAHGFDGYWCQEYGEFNELPEGWDILWKGDAAFTRRVRKGLHWVIMTKKKEWTEVAGTAAPVENIECAFEELGGEEGAKRRQRGKEKGQKKREKHLTEQLKTAILQRFPKIPKSHGQKTSILNY